MSTRTRIKLIRLADHLERFAASIVEGLVLVITDAAFGKARYRKRTSTARPRQVVYKTVIRPTAPRLVIVDENKRVKAVR